MQERKAFHFSKPGSKIGHFAHPTAAIRIPSFSRRYPAQEILGSHQQDDRETAHSDCHQTDSSRPAFLSEGGSSAAEKLWVGGSTEVLQKIENKEAGEKSDAKRKARHAHSPSQESDAGMPGNKPEKKRCDDPTKDAKPERFLIQIAAFPLTKENEGNQEKRAEQQAHEGDPGRQAGKPCLTLAGRRSFA